MAAEAKHKASHPVMEILGNFGVQRYNFFLKIGMALPA